MYSIDIKNNKDIYDYCMQNGITDITKFIQDCFKQGYDIKKYGFLVETLNEDKKQLKTDEIREIIVEVPVDKIVERIVNVTDDTKINELLLKIQQLENRSPEIIEVPIEVIKEVEKIVTKIEYISDKTTEDELGGIIAKLKNEMNEKDLELEELKNNKKIIIDINDKTKLLQETLLSLRKEIQLKNERIKKLEKINQDFESVSSQRGAVYLNGSNLNKRI